MILIDLFAQIKNCDQGTQSNNCVTTLPHVAANENQLQNILSVIFGVFAAIAIITIMIAAVNFASAGSDTEKVARSKRAIIYALIGLAIAISAEVIVLTVLGKF